MKISVLHKNEKENIVHESCCLVFPVVLLGMKNKFYFIKVYVFVRESNF